jgi:opacity protein-like surface antigen
MRCICVLIVSCAAVPVAAVVASAQVITVVDYGGPRASIRIGYGGHGPDWDVSFDQSVLTDRIRLRAGWGQGRWVDQFATQPPAGTAPVVARFAGSAIFYPRVDGGRPLRLYMGMGFSAYVPRHVDMDAQRGIRFIVGIEGSGDRWVVGPEAEIDAARQNDVDRPFSNDDLLFAGRIGIAVRRRF